MGIPASEREWIFRKFYRAESAARDGAFTAPARLPTIPFENEAQDYVDVYLVGEQREWMLGRVLPCARTRLQIPEGALSTDAGWLRLAVLAGTTRTVRAAHDPRATLTISLPDQVAQSWPLGDDQVIGRIPGPGVIVVGDTQVSRRHARISWEQGRYVYRDLAPTNPTLRHGQPIPNPCYLVDGDRLSVGRAELVFHG